MKEYRVRRQYRCIVLDSNVPQTVEADYNVRELDDGVRVEELIHGTLRIIGEKEGHA